MKIIVVGASGTIGKAVADALGVRHEVLRASRKGPVAVDITDQASIRAMYARVGKVDGVVNCAGEAKGGPLSTLSDADIAASFAYKLMGQVNLVRLGVEHLNDGGFFVLTAGVYSKSPPPGACALAMVNGALESFARAAALDLPRGIRINTISPPWIKESAEPLGIAATLTAAENARTYVSIIESSQTGQVIFN
jgi:NAD(P)-dependent dehydrogenase (short-subunit alcohol dehydrogenase family)